MKEGTIRVAYLSPAGTTKKVADSIARESERLGWSVTLKDLAGPEVKAGQIEEDLLPGDILFVGSPTYANHPVPHVMDFISRLPKVTGAFAVPFVTYGMVTSGVALYDLARALDAAGLGLLGGIKVPAQHSLLWHMEAPLGSGRPGVEDEREIQEFVREVLRKKEEPVIKTLTPETMNYQTEEIIKASEETSLNLLKTVLPPLEVVVEACTQCGICETSCPMGNISESSEEPRIGERCILCFNCIRLCDFGAITNPALYVLEGEIYKRRDHFNEPQETRFFV
jgi:ferredoxin